MRDRVYMFMCGDVCEKHVNIFWIQQLADINCNYSLSPSKTMTIVVYHGDRSNNDKLIVALLSVPVNLHAYTLQIHVPTVMVK